MRPLNPTILAALAASVIATPASATEVRFSTTLVAGCTMVVNHGTLAPNSDYTLLSTEETGGSQAVLTVTPLGGGATIDFSEPQFTTDSGVTGVTPDIKWGTRSGYSRDWNEIDPPIYYSLVEEIYDIDVRAAYAAGFTPGDYEITTIATCST